MKTQINVKNSYSTFQTPEVDLIPDFKIPESQGDFVDQSQDQIESDMREKIYQIRQNLKRFENKNNFKKK